MKFKYNEAFNQYIDNFKKLRLNDKKKYTVEELKKIVAILMQYSTNNGSSSKMMMNREIVDVNNGNETEEDFVEATYVYIKIIEELIADCLERKEQ